MGFGSRLKKLFKFEKTENEEFKSENDNLFEIDEQKKDEDINKEIPEKPKNKPHEIVDKKRNYKYLDDLIHSGAKEIVLDSDITLDTNEHVLYREGIKIDLNSIVINGNGHSIDAKNKTRIFLITGNNITLKNITLKNGHLDCNSESPESEGGLIRIKDGELEIFDSKLTDSSAKWGGAIFNEGTLNIKDSTISNNKAEKSKGGAIFNIGNLNIKDSDFSNNSSEGPKISGGGAIYNRGILNITSSLFSNNKVTGFNMNTGGAIDNWDEMTIEDSLLSNNYSKRGGAIRNGKNAKICNCIISENESPEGILYTDESMKIRNTSFNQNSSTVVVLNNLEDSTLGMVNCEFKDNDVEKSVICNDGKTCSIEKSIFENNLNEDSENIINKSKLILISSEIKDEGLTVRNKGTLIIKNSSEDILNKIYGLGTVENEDGMIHEVPASKKETKDDDIPNPDKYSVQVANDLDTFEKLIEEDFKNIELGSDLRIGGMKITASDITIDGKGHAIHGSGTDGIFIISGNNITFKNITFTGGRCAGDGREKEKNRQITRKEQDVNFYYYGGAIYVRYSGSCTFINCNFYNNSVGNEDRAKITRINVWYEAKGGAIYSQGICRLLSCEFSGNKAIVGNYDDFYGCKNPEPTKKHTYLKENPSQNDVSKKDKVTVRTLHKAKGTDSSFTIRGKIENLLETHEGCSVELTNTSNRYSTGQIPVMPDGTFMIELSSENPENCYELKVYDSNNNLLEISSNSSKTITYKRIDETEQIIPQNFKYLDDLIHFGEKKIKLDCDIILDDEESNEYKNGIFIDENGIVIDGNGHTISANGKARIFTITGQNITLKNITLKDGNAKEDGGAIYNLGSVTLKDSTITQCTAEYGGAIRNNNGELTLQNNRITENFASWFGGAIHNDNGMIILQNNTFGQNKAGFYGGAISNWGKLNAKNDRYIENSSTEEGGAVYNNYMLELRDCEFSQNHCVRNIILNKDILEIYKTQFNLNESEELIFNRSNTTLYANDCIFKDNSIEKSIIHNKGKSCTLKKCIFDNELSGITKNIINQTDLTFENSKITNDSKSILNNGKMLLINSPPDMEDKIEGKGDVEIFERISNEERFDFGYLDNLIHNTKRKKIILEEDITFENYEKDFYEGGIELDIDDLTIDGNGKTINGINKSRIFIITGNNITLKNIVFKNGKSHKSHYDSSNNHGGALKINNENKLKIENCEFISNTSEENGGAINNEKGSVTIKDTEFNENSALNGGAISNGGTCIIQNYPLNNNHAIINGGTIYNNGKLTMNDSQIEESTAKKDGGTIYNDQNGKITITKTTLNNGRARNGGMIVNFGNTTIKDSKIFGNQAKGSGGAIVNTGTFNITNSTLKYNHANNDGGAIDNRGKLTIKDSTLSNSSAKKHGGLIHNDENGILTIIYSTIKENLMEGSIISNGQSGRIISYGGAISNKGELTLKDSILTDNEAKVEHYSEALYCKGGAIHNTGKLKITSCEFKNNVSKDGGAIDVEYGTCTINKSIFENNHSRSSGGAINGACTINNSKFSNNCAGLNGGAVNGGAVNGKVTAKNTIMTENTAKYGGGAIYSFDKNDLKLDNCEIHDNKPNNISFY